ncbi:type II toxin-antitoxin system Phd/YefM family antitoxin [Phenylobacterium sp.]|uniref:type II toxin-antitoxin system Phd/YefM family antitoxin n=1 Tax=Phenylobacterium sp. TaxID=1871053 RepID=UPI0025E59854|nr:type II toxin-antitoxin system Phd/YefM family antitoxin [Phenylobacterium sp.]MBX3483150.1 type II toxin-antitoxin system Phd/YefM family antitoxin [Phenylobacterium sp.]MCW5760744.1 type II toxin-antitoxin system Phd/YefM family antitoxin [Phenylobacterium sp.]
MNAWKLESAKARLSEVVRQARDEGPQTITVRGREAAVVVSTEEYRRLKGGDGKHWVDRLRAIGPIDFEFERDPDTGRDIDL